MSFSRELKILTRTRDVRPETCVIKSLRGVNGNFIRSSRGGMFIHLTPGLLNRLSLSVVPRLDLSLAPVEGSLGRDGAEEKRGIPCHNYSSCYKSPPLVFGGRRSGTQ